MPDELASTTPAQTVCLGRLVDMTTNLLRHREKGPPFSRGDAGGFATTTRVDPETGATPIGDIVSIPRMAGTPPHVAEMIRSLYGVDLVPTSRHAEQSLADERREDTTEN